MNQLDTTQRERVRMFLFSVNLRPNISEVLVPAIMTCNPVKSLFQQDELTEMWPQYVESRIKSMKKSSDVEMLGK